MDIIAHNERTGEKSVLGQYPTVPIPRKNEVIYLKNGQMVTCDEVRYHYDRNFISIHYYGG